MKFGIARKRFVKYVEQMRRRSVDSCKKLDWTSMSNLKLEL